MFDQLVQYLVENYPRARKIVEVGVGHRIDVARRVKEILSSTEVLVTDKDETWARLHETSNVRTVADDVMYPQLPIYENAALIYSVNPPIEIVPALEKLSGKVGADLLVVPLSDEQEALPAEKWRKIVRTGYVVGWLLPGGSRVRSETNQG